MNIAVIIFYIVLISIVMYFAYRYGKKYALYYMLIGFISYLVCFVTGSFYAQMQIEFNIFNIVTSTFGGVPGVAFLYGLKYIL